MSKQNILVGKTIASIQLANDKQAIRFVLADGSEVVAKTDGDCCSYSWVENVSLPALGLPATVLAVDDLDLPNPQDQPDYGEILAYGCKITTDRGDLSIEYRNESNGYYGGNLWWPREDDSYNHFYGGVHGQNESTCEWDDPLTADA